MTPMHNHTYAEVGAKIARLADRCGRVGILISPHDGWTPSEEVEDRDLSVPLVVRGEMDARNAMVLVQFVHSNVYEIAHWDLATALDLAWEAIQ